MQSALFADDTANYAISYRVDTIINRLTILAKKQLKYFEKWKIKINATKTEAIFFSRRRPNLPENITVFNQNLIWAKSIRYLGIYLDPKLTFSTHVNKIREKFYTALKILYPIFNRFSKLNKHNKSLLYKTCLRPVITYASPVWSNTCKTNMKKLQTLQNTCLRIIGDYPMYTTIDEMHNHLHFEPLITYIDKINTKFFANLHNTNNVLLNKLILSNVARYRKYKYKRLKHRYLT